MSFDRNVRDLKTSQMASNGPVFYESKSQVRDWDLTKWANAVGGQQASVCRFVITATAKKKTFLLADLIIDKVLINSASPIRIDKYHTNIAGFAMSVAGSRT